jgi:anaerobic selenocysteine-containing dehydrogenase
LLYSVGGNFILTLPEPGSVIQALGRVPVRVHQDIILTTQMLVEPAEEVILLPAKTRYEQDGGGIETSTERRIMFSPEIPRQVGEARAEWKILRDLAVAVAPEKAPLIGCETGQAIREEIARIVPFYDGVQNLRQTGDAVQYGGARLCEGGRFLTADGKAHFRTVSPAASSTTEVQFRGSLESNGDSRALSPALFALSTRRGKQFNSLVYAEVDPINGAPRDAVLIHPEDAAALQLAQNDTVRLRNDVGSCECRVFLAPIARGNLQVHWPEGNVLLSKGVVEPSGGVPDYNTTVQIEKVSAK